jgi:hypothetical protein
MVGPPNNSGIVAAELKDAHNKTHGAAAEDAAFFMGG